MNLYWSCSFTFTNRYTSLEERLYHWDTCNQSRCIVISLWFNFTSNKDVSLTVFDIVFSL
jgi:hypothetical protein